MRYYEDLVVGALQVTQEYTVTADEIIRIAEQFDPMPIHTDVGMTAQSEFGGLIASGVHIIALWRKLDFEITRDINVVCGLGLDKVRFVRPLFANDTIKCESKVLSKHLSATRNNCGIVHFRHRVINQNGALVSSHTSKVLLRCASAFVNYKFDE